MDANTINSLDSDQNLNDKFIIDERWYILDINNLDNTHTSATGTNSLPHTCNLDLEN